MNPLVVAKVGGSLFDLSDLRDRLIDWIARVGDARVLLVPGGGRAADTIRQLDWTHKLGETSAHCLALGVLSVHAHFLSELVDAPIVAAPGDLVHRIGVLDAFEFSRSDESRAGALEHSWRVTSDSIAARAAVLGGGDLVLLKSTDLPGNLTWAQAAASGLVDEAFPNVISRSAVRVSWVNLRRWRGKPREPGSR